MKVHSSILWFRNDLRLHDNPVLNEASRESEQIVPVYIFDPRDWEIDEFSHRITGPQRTRFLLESVAELRSSLKKRGNDLLILKGDTSEVLGRVAKEYNCGAIYASKEFDPIQVEREKEVLRNVTVTLELRHSNFLYAPQDAAFKIAEMPDSFNTFRKRCENKSMIRPIVADPSVMNTPVFGDESQLPELSEFGFDNDADLNDKRAVLKFHGGEISAMNRLEEYFWENKSVRKFYNTRDQLIGSEYSSKFSPWLALGCLSSKLIKYELDKFESTVKKNKSTYWVKLQLTWRDYYRFLTMKYGKHLFFKEGISEHKVEFHENPELFEKWKNGNTGIPFIDANMRELKHTGYMSSRGRINVSSFLAKTLNLDWRYGASWFRYASIDYDVYSNWGNWAYLAGVATDTKDLKFNPAEEMKKYDPKAEYIKIWIPELKNAKPDQIMNWHQLSASERKKAAPDYAEPVTDLND